ncbi:MAG: hypothetical protein KGI06_06275, partial [Candidatus Micrarchaeota archaeon]|nr:hypothetical protein [Candidatus Micrarchaeota archaeon]
MTTEWPGEESTSTTNPPVTVFSEGAGGLDAPAPAPPETPPAWLQVTDTPDLTGHCTVSGSGLRGTDGLPVRERDVLTIVVDGAAVYHVAPYGLEGEYQTAISAPPGPHHIEIRDGAGTVLAAR